MNKFKRVYNGTDAEEETYQRVFSGRLTKGRYKRISRFCKAHTNSSMRCGHDWDCCGCVCRTYMEFTYKHNLITVTYVQHRNY